MLLSRRHFLCIISLTCALTQFVFPEPPFLSSEPGGSCEFREDLRVCSLAVTPQRGAFSPPQVEVEELQINSDKERGVCCDPRGWDGAPRALSCFLGCSASVATGNIPRDHLH